MGGLVTVALIGVTALGAGCLNYTKAFGVESHYAFAEESGMPAPSGAIYFAGLGLTVAGAGLSGFRLGRRRR